MKAPKTPPAATTSETPSNGRLLGLRILVQAGLLMVAILALRQQQLQMSRQASKASHLRELQGSVDDLRGSNHSRHQQNNNNQEALVALQLQVAQLKSEKASLSAKLEQAEQRVHLVEEKAQLVSKEEEEENDQQTSLQLELHKLRDEREALLQKLEAAEEEVKEKAVEKAVEEKPRDPSKPTPPSLPAPLIHSNLKLQLGTKELRQEQNYTSPACTLQVEDDQVFNRIVFLHMRKAGGTSVRNYLKAVAEKHNIPLYGMEGYKEVETPGDVSKTLYVTHLREPISRAISHYKYEQRWDCAGQLWQPNFVPRENNTLMSLSEFASKEWAKRSKFWSCSQECYGRWATAWHQSEALTSDELEPKGRATLGSYHLMIVSEWLKDPDYSRSLEALFGVPEINRKKSMSCGEASANANKAVPLHPTQDDYDLIAKNNQRDIRMYHDFTTCPQGPQFWGRRIRFEPYSVPEGEIPAIANLHKVEVANYTWN